MARPAACTARCTSCRLASTSRSSALLFFAKPLVEAVSDFAPGTEVNTLPVDGGRISTAICYEVVYPGLIREGVQNGSALLTTITNDAWFGRSSAPWQHFAMAAMRAVEQGRYLVRAANTGISGVVDPYGRVLLQSGLFVEGAWTADVRLIEAEDGLRADGGLGGVGESVADDPGAGDDNHEGTKARRREASLIS